MQNKTLELEIAKYEDGRKRTIYVCCFRYGVEGHQITGKLCAEGTYTLGKRINRFGKPDTFKTIKIGEMKDGDYIPSLIKADEGCIKDIEEIVKAHYSSAKINIEYNRNGKKSTK